jgi:hypothetical protein
MLRSTTLFNGHGDTTIAWSEDRDEVMEALIAKKMAEGVVFFVIENRAGLRSRLTDPGQALSQRALAIGDDDFAKFVGDGNGEVVPTPATPARKPRISRKPAEVAKSQSVAVRPSRGG